MVIIQEEEGFPRGRPGSNLKKSKDGHVIFQARKSGSKLQRHLQKGRERDDLLLVRK